MDKTGLTIEAAELLRESDGISAASRTIGSVKITDVRVRENARIGKRPGRYITLEGEPSAEGMTALFRRALTQLLPASGRIFTVGLGNPDITQDSLGALTARGITAGKRRRYTVCAMETDVAAKTGLDTARLVKAAAKELPADCVIAVDALACRDPKRIGKTVQLSDAGIIPGSGTGARYGELSRERLGIPIAAVGVPTMTVYSDLTGSEGDGGFLVTAMDIDIIVKQWSEVIAGAIDDL